MPIEVTTSTREISVSRKGGVVQKTASGSNIRWLWIKSYRDSRRLSAGDEVHYAERFIKSIEHVKSLASFIDRESRGSLSNVDPILHDACLIEHANFGRAGRRNEERAVSRPRDIGGQRETARAFRLRAFRHVEIDMRIKIDRGRVQSRREIYDRNASGREPSAKIRFETNLVVSFQVCHVEAIVRRINHSVSDVGSDAAQLVLNLQRRTARIKRYDIDVRQSERHKRGPLCFAPIIGPGRSVPLHDQSDIGSVRQLFGFFRPYLWRPAPRNHVVG